MLVYLFYTVNLHDFAINLVTSFEKASKYLFLPPFPAFLKTASSPVQF